MIKMSKIFQLPTANMKAALMCLNAEPFYSSIRGKDSETVE